jgi:thymidylate synthase
MFLKTTTIPDAWYQAIYNLVEYDEEKKQFKNGILYTIDQGSYEGSRRLEYPYIMIEINNPLVEPYIPDFPPAVQLPPIADMDYVFKYFQDYIMNPEIPANETYTYSSRIHKKILGKRTQFEILIERLKQHPHSNQLVLQIAEPEDILLDDPPCLRHIGCKVIDNRLDLHVLFRSNSLFSAFPVNMASIALLMEYILTYCENLIPGKIIYFGSGLHLYEHDFDLVKTRLCRQELDLHKRTTLEETNFDTDIPNLQKFFKQFISNVKKF